MSNTAFVVSLVLSVSGCLIIMISSESNTIDYTEIQKVIADRQFENMTNRLSTYLDKIDNLQSTLHIYDDLRSKIAAEKIRIKGIWQMKESDD